MHKLLSVKSGQSPRNIGDDGKGLGIVWSCIANLVWFDISLERVEKFKDFVKKFKLNLLEKGQKN